MALIGIKAGLWPGTIITRPLCRRRSMMEKIMPANKLPARSEPATGLVGSAFNSLRREVDRLFDDFDGWPGRTPFSRALSSDGFYAPAMDIAEKNGNFELTAEMPGLEEKDIEVKLTNGGISIRGEKKSDREEKNKNYYLSERSYGSFDRYFTLPAGVDATKISASFKNGLLTVTLPKTPEAQKSEKKIPIKGA